MKKPLTDGERLLDASVVTGNWDFSKKPEGHSENTSNARIAVIGDNDVVSVFAAVGFEIFPFTYENKVKETIKELAAKDYSLILITEECIKGLDNFLAAYNALPYPIILPIPDGVSVKGFALERVTEKTKKVNATKGNNLYE